MSRTLDNPPRHDEVLELGDDDHTQYLTSARHSAVDHDGLTINHDGLENVTSDQHHGQSHAIDGGDHTGTLAHSATSSQTADDHHAKSHGHDGVDGSGTVAHSATTGQGTDDHHNQDHAARHREEGADELLKHAREAVTIGGSAASNVTHTWTSAFADANYTVSADIELDNDANISAPSWYIRSVTASAVTVRVVNNAITSQGFTVHLVAVHD